MATNIGRMPVNEKLDGTNYDLWSLKGSVPSEQQRHGRVLDSFHASSCRVGRTWK